MDAALLNGRAPDGSLATSRGLHYGDGIFRTMLLHQGQLLDWALHLRKLADDCARLQLSMPDAGLLQAECRAVAGDAQNAVIKLMLLRKASGRGYAPATPDCDRLLLRSDMPRYAPACWSQGIEAFRCALPLAPQPALAGIKHLNRLEQVLASRDWPQGAMEGIMCDPQGRPICGTRSNLFWVSGGTLVTPDLSHCGVAGMMRGKLLAIAAEQGIPAQVRAADWNELEHAEEVLVSNSLIGLWPVSRLDQTTWAAPGPVSARLIRALNHPRLA